MRIQTSCRWLILLSFRMFHYAFTPTFLLTLQHWTKRHSHFSPTKPPWVLSACPHIVFLIHYQWGCSRKCCLITSHTGLLSLWSLWSNLSPSVYLTIIQLSKIIENSLPGWIFAFSVTQIWLFMFGLQRGDLISCLHGATNLIFVLFLCKSSKQHLHLNVLCYQYSLCHL